MKFLLIENKKSLYEEYSIIDEKEYVKYKVVGKKEVDEIFEIYKEDSFTKIKLKKINYFGQTNFEVYYDEEFIATIGEEINSFNEIYYFDFNGWKLIYDEEKSAYIVTDINDEKIFELLKPVLDIRENYEIKVYDMQDILGAIAISIVMYIYDKDR